MSSDTASEKSGKRGATVHVTLDENEADSAAQLAAGSDVQLDEKQAARLRYVRFFSTTRRCLNSLLTDGKSIKTFFLSCAVRVPNSLFITLANHCASHVPVCRDVFTR